ncbi:translation initiation factor IF-2-like [Lontra canadensis]|uniref:translation initiation factor IF-2-like n=1 Tax=Lontra canadensis TaxID=76717 RepID=UPI0013F31182|nr:translation initiation factor IF-2-like [Lontra canadensis]
MSSEKELVNLMWYEVINKKSGGVDLFELMGKNVNGGKSVIQNFIACCFRSGLADVTAADLSRGSPGPAWTFSLAGDSAGQPRSGPSRTAARGPSGPSPPPPRSRAPTSRRRAQHRRHGDRLRLRWAGRAASERASERGRAGARGARRGGRWEDGSALSKYKTGVSWASAARSRRAAARAGRTGTQPTDGGGSAEARGGGSARVASSRGTARATRAARRTQAAATAAGGPRGRSAARAVRPEAAPGPCRTESGELPAPPVRALPLRPLPPSLAQHGCGRRLRLPGRAEFFIQLHMYEWMNLPLVIQRIFVKTG